MKLNYIVWRDAAQSYDGWTTHNSVPNGILINMVGFVVEETDKGLTLTQAYDEYNTYNNPFFIPWSCIEKRWELS